MSGKKAVVYFYGADGAPSCTKQAKAFDAAALDATVVGVRSDEGVKEGFSDEYGGVKFVVDEGNEVREEVGIAKDLFGFLPGRETYVLDKSGELGRARALGVVWLSPPACMARPPSTAPPPYSKVTTPPPPPRYPTPLTTQRHHLARTRHRCRGVQQPVRAGEARCRGGGRLRVDRGADEAGLQAPGLLQQGRVSERWR